MREKFACTCGSLCDLHDPHTCDGFVKPIGASSETEEWVHSCREHYDILVLRCCTAIRRKDE